MNQPKELNVLMKMLNVLTKSGSYFIVFVFDKESISVRWKNAVMYFYEEMPSASNLTELRGGIAPLVSLARLLSVALAYEMLRGKKKRSRKARALRWRQPFPRVEHQFLVLRSLARFSCLFATVIMLPMSEYARDVHLLKSLIHIRVFCNPSVL